MRALISVCYGTAHPETLRQFFFPAHAMLCAQFDTAVLCVCSSRMRAALRQNGLCVPDLEEALESVAAQGASSVFVQTLLMARGAQWEHVQALCRKWRPAFATLTLSPPLLPRQARDCAHILSAQFPRRNEEGVVLVTHAQPDTRADFAALQCALFAAGRDDMLLLEPHAPQGTQRAAAYFRRRGIASVTLGFAMLCAGHHAHHAALCPDGVCARLSAQGLCVRVRLDALGQTPAFAALFAPYRGGNW